MFRNQFKYSFRAFKRQKAYVLINVSGLAIGLACALIIILFVGYELSYDQYNEKKDRIYKVILHGKLGGQDLQVTSTASVIGPTMRNEFPEVEEFLRINGWGETVLNYGDRHFTEKNFIQADSTFFEFFSVPLIRGNARQVLNEPHTLVLSESTAAKIFGNEDPINQMIRVENDTTPYRVTGIMQDLPGNTHFDANAIGSFMTNPRSKDDRWLSNSFDTYVMLHNNANPRDAEARIDPMIEKYVGPDIQKFFGISMKEFLEMGNQYSMYLLPLSDIHLATHIEHDLKAANDPRYLWIFGSIAILILVIASINFMNLSTAQATKRAKEVGIKKVSGSTRGLLIRQFMLETILLSLIALVITIVITEVSLPWFNELLGLHLTVGYFSHWYVIPGLLIGTITIGALAGSYPAFYLSSFNPYKVLKGITAGSRGKNRLKSVLVVLQFTISIILIIGTMIMHRQLDYMMDKDLGFDKEHVFVIRRAGGLGNKVAGFKEEVRVIPGVLNISSSTAVPGHNNNNNGYLIKGRPEESYLMFTNWVDYDYFETYGIKLADGRFFDQSFKTDPEACVINENVVKSFTLDDPLTTRFLLPDDESDEVQVLPVIGVATDFHHESLKSGIAPYVFRFKGEDMNWGYISIKLSPSASSATLDQIEETWKSFSNNTPMQSFFMDKDFMRLYREERQNAQLAVLFAILGIFIASLGLFGLTSFTIAQRTKEIGVRKTFGASINSIWYLIAKEIMMLVGVATVIAWPLSYWVADNWLQNYHYRINLRPTDFILGFVIALGVALITVTHHTLKTAWVTPSESLRYE